MTLLAEFMYRKIKNPFLLAFRCIDSREVQNCFGVEAGKLRTGRFLRTTRMSIEYNRATRISCQRRY